MARLQFTDLHGSHPPVPFSLREQHAHEEVFGEETKRPFLHFVLEDGGTQLVIQRFDILEEVEQNLWALNE